MSYDLRKTLIFFLILVLPAFVFKEYKVLKAARQPHHVSESAPQAPKPRRDHHFVVVYIANGLSPFIEKSLDSICNQTYQNYRLVCVQNSLDASTQKKIEECLFRKKMGARVEILSYNQQIPLASIYKQIIRDCKDDDIVVQVNQHDWLARYDVLETLNQVYQDDDTWLAYGNRLEYPSLKRPQEHGKKGMLNQRRLLKMPWSQASIRSFYVHLLRQVDLDALAIDLTGDEEVDYAFLAPMLRLAKWHIRHVPEVLSVHNRLRVFDHQPPLVLGQMMDQFSNNLKTCANLAKGTQIKENQKADLIILSSNNPYRLDVCLESVFRYMHGLDMVYVVFDCDDSRKEIYKQLQAKYPIAQFKQAHNSLKPMILAILHNQSSTTKFVTVTTDDQLVQQSIQLSECIQALNQTDADVFYLSVQCKQLIQNRNYSHPKPERIHILQQNQLLFPTDLVLYRKNEFTDQINKINFSDIPSLGKAWHKSIAPANLGLYYESSKASKLK